MRAGLAIVISLVFAAGCKSGGESEADAAALRAQQELLAKRDALVAARDKLKTDREAIEVKITAAKAQGSDAAEYEKQRDDIDRQLADKSLLSSLDSKLGEIKAAGDKATDTVGREQRAADREKLAADREQRAADREKLASEREVAANARAQECVASAAPVIMQVQAPPKGTNYTKSDVQPLLQRARNAIAKKGLLPSDLGPLAALEGESTKAMAAGDWGTAYLAANQLAQNVDALKVDQGFIRQKVLRFNASWAAHKQDAATQKQIQDGTSEVTKSYSDAHYDVANGRLNQLFGLLK